MFILLASATYNEINTTINWLKSIEGETDNNETEVLITGVGSTAAAYSLTRQIQKRTPELIIQAGIGGSFSDRYQPTTVLAVKEDVFADLGAYSSEGFDDIFDLGLASSSEKPFTNRMLLNEEAQRWNVLSLPLVRGATINRISSQRYEVESILKKYSPDVESMEGAALHYVCILEGIPFFQIRAVSNFVGERDKKRWKMKEAIDELNKSLRRMINEI